MSKLQEKPLSLKKIKISKLLMSKLQKKPAALKREHPAFQKMKFINFFLVCRSFLPFWIRILNANPDLDTDPGTPLSPDPTHTGSTTTEKTVVFMSIGT
jgi:hypothetical protein